MNIDKFLEIVGYRITGGSEYLWECFGPDVWDYEIWDTFMGYSVNVIFDTRTKVLYKIEVTYNDANFVWHNPEFFESYKAEAEKRNCNIDIAWDNVKNTVVSFEEIIEKVKVVIDEIYEEI